MYSGMYSAKYKEAFQEDHTGVMQDQEYGRAETLAKNRKLSAETNKRRRQHADQRKNREDEEEHRRKEILADRKAKMVAATERYQKAPVTRTRKLSTQRRVSSAPMLHPSSPHNSEIDRAMRAITSAKPHRIGPKASSPANFLQKYGSPVHRPSSVSDTAPGSSTPSGQSRGFGSNSDLSHVIAPRMMAGATNSQNPFEERLQHYQAELQKQQDHSLLSFNDNVLQDMGEQPYSQPPSLMSAYSPTSTLLSPSIPINVPHPQPPNGNPRTAMVPRPHKPRQCFTEVEGGELVSEANQDCLSDDSLEGEKARHEDSIGSRSGVGGLAEGQSEHHAAGNRETNQHDYKRSVNVAQHPSGLPSGERMYMDGMKETQITPHMGALTLNDTSSTNGSVHSASPKMFVLNSGGNSTFRKDNLSNDTRHGTKPATASTNGVSPVSGVFTGSSAHAGVVSGSPGHTLYAKANGPPTGYNQPESFCVPGRPTSIGNHNTNDSIPVSSKWGHRNPTVRGAGTMTNGPDGAVGINLAKWVSEGQVHNGFDIGNGSPHLHPNPHNLPPQQNSTYGYEHQNSASLHHQGPSNKWDSSVNDAANTKSHQQQPHQYHGYQQQQVPLQHQEQQQQQQGYYIKSKVDAKPKLDIVWQNADRPPNTIPQRPSHASSTPASTGIAMPPRGGDFRTVPASPPYVAGTRVPGFEAQGMEDTVSLPEYDSGVVIGGGRSDPAAAADQESTASEIIERPAKASQVVRSILKKRQKDQPRLLHTKSYSAPNIRDSIEVARMQGDKETIVVDKKSVRFADEQGILEVSRRPDIRLAVPLSKKPPRPKSAKVQRQRPTGPITAPAATSPSVNTAVKRPVVNRVTLAPGPAHPSDERDILPVEDISLDKTPTDEEIDRLWAQVRSCLSRTAHGPGGTAEPSEISLPQSTASEPLGPGHRGPTGRQPVTKVTSNNIQSMLIANGSARGRSNSTDPTGHRLLQQRAMVAKHSFSPNRKPPIQPSAGFVYPAPSPCEQEPTASGAFYGQDGAGGVGPYTDSMADFLEAEGMSERERSDVDRSQVLEQAWVTASHIRNKAPSALSVEEKMLMQSLEKLDEKLKFLEAKGIPNAQTHGFKGRAPLISKTRSSSADRARQQAVVPKQYLLY